MNTTAKASVKTAAKTSTFPPLRVNEELRSAAEAALVEGETLSAFVLEAIQYNIQRRAMQQEFIARGLAARSPHGGGYCQHRRQRGLREGSSSSP